MVESETEINDVQLTIWARTEPSLRLAPTGGPSPSLPVSADDAVHNLNAINDAFNVGIAAQDAEGLLNLYGNEVMWIALGTPMSLNGREEAEKLFGLHHRVETLHDDEGSRRD